ncbi:MAG: WD40 repeat domain-containing protein [Verrucomicrobiales bacterium]|nr:WD40 repeat domain-containing protein [Verrucomicrobiales bacterium]
MEHRPSPFNPFPGLRPFETRDRIFFFGREEQTAELLRRLRETRFLSIVGSSGSGKSSLVRAGLLPGLHGGFMAEAGSRWRIAVMRPGGDPISNLSTALLQSGFIEAGYDPFSFVRSTLSRSAKGLIDCVQQFRLAPDQNLLVVVDQFEEVFRFRRRFRTLEAEAGGFVRLLLEAAQQHVHPIYVVLTMRSDFLGECAEFRGLPQAINQGQYLVPRMSRDQIRRAIEGPIRVAQGHITGRLVQRLLNDLATDADQLPVLQHALMRMWDLQQSEPLADPAAPLDLRHYEAVGTMTEALSRHLDEVYHDLPTETDRALAEGLFKALTELASDNRGVRRPTRLRELGEILSADRSTLVAVIDRFRQPGRAFLTPPLVHPTAFDGSEAWADADSEIPESTGSDAQSHAHPPALAELTDDTVIDITHESLMRVWTRLQDWVRKEASSVAILRRLAESAHLHALGQAGLYRDPELEIALRWRGDHRPTAAWADRYCTGFDLALRYLDASAAARESARQSQARKRRLQLAGLAVIAAVFFALWQFAASRQRTATAHLLALRADNSLALDPAKAVLLAAEAVRLRPDEPVAVTSLRKAVLASRIRQNTWGASLQGVLSPPEGVGPASFSPDGRQILWATGTNAVVLSVGPDPSVRTLTGHRDLVRVAQFSPTGGLALTAGWDGQGILWNSATWSPVARLTGPTAAISAAAFSPDGRWAATAGRDRTARIWQVSTGTEKARLEAGPRPEDEITSVAFNAGGDGLVLGTRGGAISAWHWSDARLLWLIGGAASGAVFDVRFAAKDSLLASTSEDGHVHLWGPNAQGAWELRSTLPAHIGRAYKTALSPDGLFLATAGQDRSHGSVVMWDLASATALYTNRHPDAVRSVTFSPDGRLLLTTCDDGRLRSWDVEVHPTAPALPTRGLRWIQMTPDGASFVFGDGSTNLQVHRATDGAPVTQLEGHAGEVLAAVTEPRAGFLASVSAGTRRNLCVWDLKTWKLSTSADLDPPPQSIALSPDGQWAVVTHDAAVSVLDTKTWQRQRTLGQQHVALVLRAAFSTDGSRLVTAGEDRTAIVWNTRTWQEPVKLQDHRAPVNDAAFCPNDPNRLVTASDTVRFYRQIHGRWRDPIEAQGEHRHAGDVATVLYSPDGSCVVSCGFDGQVLLWNSISAEYMGSLPASQRSSPSLALFHPVDGRLYSIGTSILAHDSTAWAPLPILLRDVAPSHRPLRPLTPDELGP